MATPSSTDRRELDAWSRTTGLPSARKESAPAIIDRSASGWINHSRFCRRSEFTLGHGCQREVTQQQKADPKVRPCVSKIKGKNQRFRRISIMPLASIVRSIELGSGIALTLARRNPMPAAPFAGTMGSRYVEAKLSTVAPQLPPRIPRSSAGVSGSFEINKKPDLLLMRRGSARIGSIWNRPQEASGDVHP